MSLLCSGLKDGLFHWTLKFHEYISKGPEKTEFIIKFSQPCNVTMGISQSSNILCVSWSLMMHTFYGELRGGVRRFFSLFIFFFFFFFFIVDSRVSRTDIKVTQPKLRTSFLNDRNLLRSRQETRVAGASYMIKKSFS